jgi:hypothetical protein
MPSTHIRIQSEVKDRLAKMAREGETTSVTLTRLMDYYDGVNSEDNTPLPRVNHDVTSELTDRLTAIENRLTALEQVPRIPAGDPDDMLVITDEMRETIQAQLSALTEAGWTHEDIQQKTGIVPGSLKKLSPRQNDPLKRITGNITRLSQAYQYRW